MLNDTQKLVIILRGPSGSGKSTKAKELVANEPDSIIHSTDDYFGVGNNYKFDPTKLQMYHQLNYTSFISSLSRGIKLVVVDNTNLSAWEYQRYIDAAKDNDYAVQIIEMPVLAPEVLVKRNVHGVPLVKIKQMVDKYKQTLSVDKR